MYMDIVHTSPPPRKHAFVDELASPSSRRTSSKGATSAASFSSCAHSCEVKSRPVTWWVSLGFSHFWYKRFIKLQFQWGKWGFKLTILNPPTLGAAYFQPYPVGGAPKLLLSRPIFSIAQLDDRDTGLCAGRRAHCHPKGSTQRKRLGRYEPQQVSALHRANVGINSGRDYL